jgi:DNA-directed RNA polymerase II subunit RPB2
MENSITSKDIWKLIDLYFNTKNVLYNMHYLSYQQFVEDNILSELNKKYVIHENIIDKKIYRYSLKFENIVFRPPSDEFDNVTIFPKDARIRHINYSSKLLVDILQIQEIIDLETNTTDEKILYNEKRINIGSIPIMVRSKYCSTNIKNDVPNFECQYDPGCYFIIKGLEKVVISHERICENKELIFPKKDVNYPDGIMYSVQVNSKALDSSNINITSIKMLKDKSIVLTMPHFSEIPIFIIFRVLGFETDQDIIKYIVYDNIDTNMINMIKPSLNNSLLEIYKDDNGIEHQIMTKEDAENYLIQKMKTSRKYNDTDSEIRHMQKREHLLSILENELFSHMEKGFTEKGYYLGMMCNKLLQCILKRVEPDDRDNFINKRIDLPGALMARLFEQYFKKMINECSKNFKKRMGGLTTDSNPSNIIGQIKSITIEQGFTTALATGNWGSNKKKGVAQVLHRTTFTNTIAFFRRIITPSPDASTSKMDKMRHIHSGQYGFIDPVESPDNDKIGLQKHLALTSSISINSKEQPKIIKDLLNENKDMFMYLTDVPPLKIKILTKVFINGQWYGMTNKPIELIKFLRDMRCKGNIEKTVGIAHNYKMKEIRINTDGGRLYRPLLKVKNNRLLLTKEMLDEIELKFKTNNKKIINWNDFISKYHEVIEYVDCEEAENLMIAMTTDMLNEERKKMENKVECDGKSNMINRYNNVYRKFTHCEFNPAMMLGTISSNIPFSEHNQSPRNYYYFAQAKQAMGINITSLRHRTDLTYQLYHPQVPLIHTRMAKYTDMINLPAGENLIVAIACYTGYNQEDSIIINRSAVDRGLLRATYFSKYHDEIQKNPSTSQDDIFMRPDINQTIGIQDGNYDKLNEKGFIEEETRIDPGDFIIGKVSQIQPDKNNSNKIYKDSSTKYKSGVTGVIDKVYTGIYNSDNFEMYTVKVRSERIPRVGDKLCMLGDHEILTDKGWIKFDDLYQKYHNKEEFKIATLHEGKYIKYDIPIDVYEWDFEGVMYKLTSQQVEFCITMDHEMWAKKRDKKSFELIKAKDLIGKRYNLKKNGIIDIPDIENIDINGKIFKMDDLLDLLGIFIADGCLSQNNICLAGTKERKIKHINEICNKMELKNYQHKSKNSKLVESQYEYNITHNIKCKELYEWLKEYNVGALNKYLPNFVFELNSRQAKILLSSLLSCDGTYTNKKSNTQSYYTSSQKLADDVMKLAIHAGWSAKIKINRFSGYESMKKDGSIIKANSDMLMVSINKCKNEPQINHGHINTQNGQLEEIINHKGKVYCLEVPSHVFMFRYNNKNAWSGNCSRHGQKGSIGITIPAEDMPFTKDGIQPDIIINPCCFTGNTLISTPNGLSKRIDSFSSQGLEKVWTFNDKNGFIPSFSLGLENKGIKDTVKITMYDGRTLICTPDHKFKVKSINGFEYKEAKDIKINEDNIIMGIEYTEDKIYDNEKDWSLQVGEYEFNFKDNFNREKSLAFARILGYLSTDGTICYTNKSYIGRINMGHILDAEGIVNDIEIIAGKTPKISQDHLTYNINIPTELINNIIKLDGLMTGRRTTQEASLPTFFFEETCPKALIREFLGAFFGGDGHAPYILKDIFSTIKLSQSIIFKYKNTLEEKMKNIIKLMNKLNVKAHIVRTRDCHKKIELYQNEPRIQCEIGIESNIEFLENIGFRHCLEKSMKLSLAVSYERFHNNVLKQTQNLLNKIDEIYINEQIQIKDALEKAKKELYLIEKPLDSFYSTLDLTYVNNKRRKERKDKPIVFKHDRFYTAEEYINILGCNKWFTRTEEGKINYIVKKENNYVPYFTMKINNITNNGQQEVYDIGVSTHNNFIAEGVTVKNCIPSRMTIGQLFECVLSKASALDGNFSDATPFANVNMDEAKKVLKEHGFEENGNETLYCGYTGKKMEAQIFIGPTYYLRLKHMVLDKIHCLTAEHDVLTTEGWIPINEIKEDHKVATLDNNKLVYTNPVQVLQYDNYEGKMYSIKNNLLDLDVTLNHRMYVKTFDNNNQEWSNYKLEITENIINKVVKYKKDAEWEVPEYQFNIDNLNIDLLNTNFFPEWIWKLNKSQSAKLISKILQGKNYFLISIEKLADDFMRLCLHAGLSSIKTKDEDNWKVLITDNEIIVNKNSIEKIYDYKGSVYCLQVPSEIFMVRKNGKPVWTGNSRARGRTAILTRQPTEGRSREGGLRFGEMERDAMISHGLSQFLKERFMETSDPYIINVCDNCGLIARKVIDANYYICDSCRETKKISTVALPYAFKLMVQELLAINIMPRLKAS